MKNQTKVLITLAVTALSCYFIRKFYKSDYKKEGDKYFTKKEYSTAITYYLKASPCSQVLLRLGQCYMRLRMYKEALSYFTPSSEKELISNVEVSSNVEILRWRSECFKGMGMKRDFLKEFALYEAYIKSDALQKDIMETVKEICEEETREYIEREGIRVSKGEVLKGLISIERVEEYYDEVVSEKKKDEKVEDEKVHEKLEDEKVGDEKVEDEKVEEEKVHEDEYKIVDKSSRKKKDKKKRRHHAKEDTKDNKEEDNKDKEEEDIKILIRAIISFLEGKRDLSFSLLDHSTYKYSILIKSHFFNTPFYFEVDDVTSLFFLSKKGDTVPYLMRALDMCKDLPPEDKDFLYADLLLHYISKKEYSKVEEVVSEISLTDSLLDLVGEYYLKKGEYDKLLNLLRDRERPLLLALYYLATGKKEEAISTLRKGPPTFKSYLYLGNILINEDLEESRDLFKKSIQYCTTYEEVYVVRQSLLLIEVHEYIRERKM